MQDLNPEKITTYIKMRILIYKFIFEIGGIMQDKEILELIGKITKYANDADLIIYVVDSSVPLDENDKNIIGIIENKKCISFDTIKKLY